MASIVLAMSCHPLMAQLPAVHYLYSGDMPPGAIGSAQLRRGGPLPGFFQPVEIEAPEGAEISLAAQGAFQPPAPAPVLAGMTIGPAYWLRVTSIPFNDGQEVFPTIEVIDRLCPPAGQEKRFPIVVQITQEDLELALKGNFVTRVIYLEDPQQALPARQGREQISYEADAGEDPLQMADVLGRPVAILRLGGRVPILGEFDDRQHAAMCAPIVKLSPPAYNRPNLIQPLECLPLGDPIARSILVPERL